VGEIARFIVRITGEDFFASVNFRGDGTAIRADRAISFLVRKSMQDVLARAGRFNWRVELSADECRQLAGGEAAPNE
jgi:hypothetical protein